MSALPSFRTLRLHGLRTIDESAVRIFLKFAAQQTHQHWELAETGPVDLLLISPQTADAQHQLAQAQTAAWVVPKEQEAPQDGRATLNRPLQLDAFFDLLRALGQQHGASPAPAPAAEPAPAAAVACNTATQAAEPHQPPRYRLRRWPSTALLNGHREYTRLAGFLSARFLSLTELSHLSHTDAAICSAFIDLMRRQDLLEERDTAPTPANAPAPLRPTGAVPLQDRAATPPAPASTGLAAAEVRRPGHAAELLPGFIGRLRERLGIRSHPAPAGLR